MVYCKYKVQVIGKFLKSKDNESILKIKRLVDMAQWLREDTALEEDPGFGS